jgi:hypothetical protein
MWNVEINGIEQSSKAISAAAVNQLDRQNNTFKISCKGINETYHFLECNISIDGKDVASGIVMDYKVKERGIKRTVISCTDHYYIFQHRIVIERYEDMKASDILIHLITKYAPEFSTTFIDDTASIIELFECNYMLLSEAVTKLMAYLPDHHYYIDANRAFHLFEDYEDDGVRFEKVNGEYNFLHNTLDVSYDATNIVNRVWVIGSKEAAEKEIVQYFTADGLQRYFTLAYEPNYFEIYLDDVLKLSKLDSNDDGLQDFLINKTNKVVYIPANIATPFTGVVKTVYKPTVQIIDYFENLNSDNPYLLEKVVKNKDVTDKMSARSFGKAEIRRLESIKTNVCFKTYENVSIGQRCYVNILDFNVDGHFLVKKVSNNFKTNGKVLSTVYLEAIS